MTRRDWSDRAVVDIDAGALATLVVTHADGEVVALHRNRPGDRKLALMNPPAGAGIEHQYQIDYMAGLLQGVEFDDAMRAGMADLEAIPAFEVVAQSQSGLAVTLRASAPEEDGSVWTRIEATVSGEAPASDHARQEAARSMPVSTTGASSCLARSPTGSGFGWATSSADLRPTNEGRGRAAPRRHRALPCA